MNLKQIGWSLLLGAAALLAPSTAAPSSAHAAPLYNVVNIGVLPGYVSSTATSVDSAGEVVGYDTDASGQTQAFLWTQSGGLVGLGGTNSKAFGVNGGNVVGMTGPTGQAFRWTQSTGYVLLDPASRGRAIGINNSGELVGNRISGVGNRVLTWSASNAISNHFPTLNLTGTALNDLGHFVGVNTGTGYYNDGVTTARIPLGVLPNSISNNDIAAGSQSQLAGYEDVHTLTTTIFGTLPGDATSNALGINPLGTAIVGVSGTNGFYYDIAHANLFSLTSLLAPASSGWTITSASAINDHGQIAAIGTFNGQQTAVLLMPVPEPGTLTLLAIGAACGLFVVCRSASKK